MKYALIDGKPVPLKLEAELRAIGFGDDITLNSALRTDDAVRWARSQGATLSSQKELYDGFKRDPVHFNPANPPGESTHELRNDGVAFPGPPRMPLRYYQVGLDGDDAPLACERARARGWTCTLTYPGSPREGHHVNFRKEPRLRVFKALKRGARGPRVGKFTLQLAYLGFLPKATGHFGAEAEDALRAFQRKYHLRNDAVYGVHTARQLAAAYRGRRACRRKAKKIRDPVQRGRALSRCGRRFGPD